MLPLRKISWPSVWSIFGGAFLALDLATKSLAEKFLTSPLELWPGVFILQASRNPGVAFGIPIPNLIMIFATPALLAGIIFFVVKSCNMASSYTQAVLALILAGGLGNWVSRLLHNGVTDFLSFSFWPSFNFADLYLTIAAFLFILFYGRITGKTGA